MLLREQKSPLSALFSMVFQVNDREATVDAKNRLELCQFYLHYNLKECR